MADRRKIVQCLALLVCNANIPGFFRGRIYRGGLKSLCVPGLNCYSCPGAVASCPLGSLQAVLGSYQYRFSYYVTGLMLFFGLLFGRFVCGFLCPFGLLQELLHKIPFFKAKSARGQGWRFTRWIKYALLAVAVVGLPIFARDKMGLGDPAFCKYICPAGTLTAGLPLIALNEPMRESLGWLFTLKAFIAVLVVLGCLYAYRFFCRALCPLGAFYGLFNKIALYQLRHDEHKCVRCGACAAVCKMGVDPSLAPCSPECIRCGDCVKSCGVSALSAGFSRGQRTSLPPHSTTLKPLRSNASSS